ncbi:hypothetical protein KKC13_09765 [bacterium]|nr:hypothetical protein [bacterium]MBU1958066.1 hypothetical protein [bacterium]
MDAEILTLSTEDKTIETTFTLDGFKPHKSGSYLQRPLQGAIANISQIHSPNRTIRTYELMIENSYSIEKGYSGSAIVSNDQVIGIATDRNSSGKQAYAIPIGYLKEIWEDMPQSLFETEPSEPKSNFSREVFESLESKPLLLFSTDSYVTGGYQKLTEYCFEKRVQTAQQAKKLIYESYFKSELFLAYKEDDLCMLFTKEQLGDAHPYSDNELLYRLYWDNLIVEVRGKFVWRSGFIVGLGQEVLGCK